MFVKRNQKETVACEVTVSFMGMSLRALFAKQSPHHVILSREAAKNLARRGRDSSVAKNAPSE